MSSVGEEMPKEMARVRELLPIYDSIPFGCFAAASMRETLDRAAHALAAGDIIAILCAYADLKGFHA